ncbi:MAG: hypothetical protein QM820_36290 [Minicystis sp.]
MRLSRPGLAPALALCGALAACSSSETAGTGGGGGAEPVPPDHATIRFDDEGTLTLAPGEARELGVVGEPAAPYQVAFSLLGAPLDGWLDPPVTMATTAGHALVQLHAPSQATTFHVRASLLDGDGAPGASVDRAVAVSDQGFGSIRVEPVYAGHRPVTQWTASAVAGTSCAALVGTLPEEPAGALTATAPAGEQPVIDNAPVGPSLAVVVRAGHFAWGCTDTKGLTPGSTTEVSVTVIDKALVLDGASLPTTFDYGGSADAVAPLFASAGALLGQAFLPSGAKDGSVILNAMAALVPANSTAAFAAQRLDKGWDGIAAAHFSTLSTGLRERLGQWAADGLAKQSPSFAAVLAAGASGPATVTVTRFGDLDAAAAGAAQPAPLTWSAEPKDHVLIGADLTWEPTRFAGNAALGPAQADVPGASSVPDALAAVADCPGLAAALGGFGSCDVGCVEQLCSAALGARFGAALGASQKAGLLGTIGIKASADATTGDMAEPTGLSGHWIGAFSDGALTVTVMGDLNAQ